MIVSISRSSCIVRGRAQPRRSQIIC
eukprot:Gb_24850 [translate_table: standard]